MCGVLAIWNRDGSPIDRAALERGLTAMRHRGPDDEGYVLIDTRSGRAVPCRGRDTRDDVALPALDTAGEGTFDLALGHRRLAILDPSSAGHQPMSAGDGALWVSFNGMIYNHAEIRARLAADGYRFRSRSDTEVVLHAYDRWGTACVEHFNGMWAFALWDARRRRLFASRDRLGIKPLVHAIGEKLAAFSSELKGLAPLADVDRTIDAEALHHYFSLMKVPAPFTIRTGVRKLMPGRSIVLDTSSADEQIHWKLEPKRLVEGPDRLEQIDDLLRDSVRLRLGGDVPVGTMLSGGVDSSVVTALAARLAAGRPLATYTLTSNDGVLGNEAVWAERVASDLATQHHPVAIAGDCLDDLPRLVEMFDEPFSVSSVIGVHRLAAEASKRVKVLLTGDGGDEVFAGYAKRYINVDALWDRIGDRRDEPSRERVSAHVQRVRWRPPGAEVEDGSDGAAPDLSNDRGRETTFNLWKMTMNDPEKRALYTGGWRDRTRGMSTLDWLGARLPPRGPERLARWQMHDIQTSLHDEMLAKVDKAAMACGVEARVPLLDHRVVELAMSLPAELKIGGGEGKSILKKLGERYVPREVLYREKRGFEIPLSQWLAGPWRTFVRDTLSESSLARAGVLEPRAVGELIEHHDRSRSYDSAHMVFTLLCFQLWHDGPAGRAA